MLAERMRQLIAELRLTQSGFAARCGLPVDRVRNVVKGNVQKLRDDEVRAIRNATGARELWLTTGKGPVFLTEEERKLLPALDATQAATEAVAKLGLDGPDARALQELLAACNRGDGPGASACLDRLRHSGAGPALDGDLLQGVVEETLRRIMDSGGKVPPTKLAGILVAAYQGSAPQRRPDVTLIDRLVKLAS